MIKAKPQMAVLLLLLGISLVLAGCWDRQELNDLAIVAALGIDSDAQGLYVTVQLVRPQGVQSGASSNDPQNGAYWVIGARGDSIFDAIRNVSLLSSRKLFFSHTQLVVLGEETATQGFSQHLDFLIRDPEIRSEAFVLVVKGTAADFFTCHAGFNPISSFSYAELITNRGTTSKFPQMTLSKLSRQNLTPGIDPVVTLAELSSPQAAAAKGLPFNLDSGTMQTEAEGEKSYAYGGAAVFRGDQLVGELTTHEARGLLWMLNEVESGIVVVTALPNGGKVSVEILGAQAQTKPQMRDGRITFATSIQVEARLGAIDARTAPAMWRPEQLQELANLLSDQVRLETLSAVQKHKP